MNDILRPYAILATIGLSDKNTKSLFLIWYGSGATRRQNVTISAARSMNVNV